MKKIKRLWMYVVILMIGCSTCVLSSCKDDDDKEVIEPKKEVSITCTRPQYLKAGDKIALISPSYFTPMENVEKTADVLRNWGFEPVIGPNVGKVVDGRYAGTIAERVSDLRWALNDPEIKASDEHSWHYEFVPCQRGRGYDQYADA